MSRLLQVTLFTVSWVVLGACAEVVPNKTPSSFEPLTLSTTKDDSIEGLASHSSGVYAVGMTNGNLYGTQRGGGDAFIRKVRSSGTPVWGRQFGTFQSDSAQGVASDAGNNAYVVGTTNGSLAGSKGNADIFLRKYSASGGSGAGVWTRQLGGPGNDYAGDVAVVASVVYVAGSIQNASTGDYTAYLAKYTTSGTPLWNQSFGTSTPDTASDVAVDSGGNAYVVGYTHGTLRGSSSPNGGGADIFVRKYKTDGNIAWTRQIHYSEFDRAKAVTIGGSNVYLVGDYPYDSGDGNDIVIIKLTTSGEYVWEIHWNSGIDQRALDISFNGGVYMSSYQEDGYHDSWDGNLVKFSAAGDFLWSRAQASDPRFDDFSNAVLARTSSEVYVAGKTWGDLGGDTSGLYDAFLRRLNGTTGTAVWTDQ